MEVTSPYDLIVGGTLNPLFPTEKESKNETGKAALHGNAPVTP